jgi:DNA-binding transcriptional regulator YhcF (GntR family)
MEFKDDRPIYMQIADLVMEKILSGEWGESDRIPSVRETASSVEVNPNTVVHAYTYLQEQGIIYNRRGIGYHVAPDGESRARELKRETFVREVLPQVFRTMRALDMDMEELGRLYRDFEHNTDSERKNNEDE